MYSTHNEGKYVVSKRLIRTLKKKIYKHLISISRNGHIDKLNDLVNEYNNIYRRTSKMKPIDVKDNTYNESNKEVNGKDPKFQMHQKSQIFVIVGIFLDKGFK